MSQAASQAAKFYKDVEACKKIWTIRDSDGFPAPKTSSGKRSIPFWSTKSRTEIIIKNVVAYKNFEPVELDIKEFKNWLKILIKNDQLAGINWSGKKAIGYDLDPIKILDWVESLEDSKGFLRRIFRL